MTQEEKQLLIKDLCARLSYGVKVRIILPNHQDKIFEEQIGDLKELTIYGEYLVNSKGIDYRSFELDIKPYLRPMSSMTDEEKYWYESLRNALTYQENGEYDLDDFNELNDFLNRRKLDRYGLIEKGLALEAPEGMYKF